MTTFLKTIFSWHGIPAILVTDSEPQYFSAETEQFSSTYRFQADKTVKTVKSLVSNSYLALLNYRTTPLPWCGLSPAELLMGRVIRTDVPQQTSAFQPKWPYLKDFREREKKYRDDQKHNYDKCCRTRFFHRSLSLVWHAKWPGARSNCITYTSPDPTYRVTVPSGEVRWNRSHLRNRTSGNSEVVTSDNSAEPDTNPFKNWHRDLTSTLLKELALQLGGRCSIKANYNAVIA